MKVVELFKEKKRTLSFEFFPPKTSEQENQLFAVVTQLKKFNPDFVSVTYGAMGTTRDKTFFWVNEIKKKFQIEPIAHLTCIAATKGEIEEQIEYLKNLQIENILALRGDPPTDLKNFVPPEDGFRYAKDLISFIKQRNSSFCLGAAGFPEGHREAPSLEKDTEYLKQKIDAGAEYVITQLFFDNRYFPAFLERCEKAGIEVPIIPGIMPITSLKQIKKITQMCGATIPKKLLEKLERHQEDLKSIQQISVEQTVIQCQELLKTDIPGLHFFVLNQAEPISQILGELKSFNF